MLAAPRTDTPLTETALLRLLLGDPRLDPDDLDWSLVLPIAERHGVLLRLSAWFGQRGEVIPQRIGAAMDAAEQRLEAMLGQIQRIEERCARNGVAHVFLKIAQQYPDVGRDLDVLVAGRAADVDDMLLDGPGPRRAAPDFRSRLAATTSYPLPGCDASLVVHHGRLGRLGEHGRLASQLLRRKRRVRLAEVTWSAPSPEDALLIQALHRLYGRPVLKLRDAHWTLSTLRRQDLDWRYLVDAARRAGMLSGLSCFLDYAEQIHRQVLGSPLVPAEQRARLALGTWGRVEFRGGAYRFPAASVTSRLYFREFCSDVTTGNWGAAGRLCLLPVLAATAGYQRLAQPTDGGR